ncbi:serine/threonine protein kinase [bacterium]|nr:serine/threonine protein kinase [bacterium]
MIGTTLGHYRLEAEISRGGMGTVYRARHVETDAVAAVKVLQPVLAADRAFLLRFRREVQALQQIHHPNVIEVYEVGSEGDRHYYAMEFLERTLADLLRGGPLAPVKALQIARQVADGLGAAHASSIFHRDIKPENILFDAEGCVKISDFGIAKVAEATRMTQTGTIIGTPAYMAPEQAEGPNVDGRADVYSLGVVLYEMVTGRVPFEGKTALDVLRKHRFSLPENPKSINLRLSSSLSSFILQMLDKSPPRRPPNMEALATAFERMEHNLTRGTEPRPDPRPRERKASEVADQYERAVARVVRWAKIAGIVAAAALVVYLGYRWNHYTNLTPSDYLREARAAEGESDSSAIEGYEGLIERFPDSDEAVAARQRINAIRQRAAEARARNSGFLAADSTASSRSEIAYTHFKRAEQVAAAGDLEHALRIYRMVRENFTDTPWGPRADARLQALEAELKARKDQAPTPEP